MLKTTNYELNLPEYSDVADIMPAVTENMEKIDTVLFGKLDKSDLSKLNNYGITTGSAIAYNLTLNPTPIAYTDGMEVIILPHIACGNNPTLNINGLGSLTLRNSNGDTLLAGDLKANIPYSFVRVGSNFFMRSSDDYARKAWASVIGSPLVFTQNVPTLKNNTQTIKNTMAANITSKGVPVVGTDTLKNLADAIARITIATLGGKYFASGDFTIVNEGGNYFTVANVGFIPNIFICTDTYEFQQGGFAGNSVEVYITYMGLHIGVSPGLNGEYQQNGDIWAINKNYFTSTTVKLPGSIYKRWIAIS